jgi:hypothetical protein
MVSSGHRLHGLQRLACALSWRFPLWIGALKASSSFHTSKRALTMLNVGWFADGGFSTGPRGTQVLSGTRLYEAISVCGEFLVNI